MRATDCLCLQIHPIAAVEIEVSIWSYEDETKKGSCSIARTTPIFLS